MQHALPLDQSDFSKAKAGKIFEQELLRLAGLSRKRFVQII